MVAAGVCLADDEPVPEAAPEAAATGVPETVLSEDGAAELQAAQLELAATLEPSAGLLDDAAAVLEQDVDVLVQTGTEMVHGQSVTVKVVEEETV